jgi:hypothetical protein
MEFLRVQEGRTASAGGAPIRLRVFNLGGWLCLEEKGHFHP